MTGADDWEVFVQAHGEVIGYDLGGETFLPTGPVGDGLMRRACERLGRPYPLGVPVYGPRAEEVHHDG